MYIKWVHIRNNTFGNIVDFYDIVIRVHSLFICTYTLLFPSLNVTPFSYGNLCSSIIVLVAYTYPWKQFYNNSRGRPRIELPITADMQPEIDRLDYTLLDADMVLQVEPNRRLCMCSQCTHVCGAGKNAASIRVKLIHTARTAILSLFS